jgi:uncharacterized membrane protein
MIHAMGWWLAVEVLGLAALPLAWRLFRNLPDRGYALAKPLGMLLTSYLFWVAVSLGILANSRTAIVLCVLLVGSGSLLVLLGRRGSATTETGEETQGLRQWLRSNLGLILTSEILFAVAFAVLTLVRAYNPEISATEKPMDFAFLNGILRSEYFPPGSQDSPSATTTSAT